MNSSPFEVSDSPENRGGSGRFSPGQSGNPGGRPKDVHRVAELAREHTREAVETLVELMRSSNDRVRVTASIALLDRGWGKAAQEVRIDTSSDDADKDEIRAEIIRLRQDPRTREALLVLANAQSSRADGAT